MKQKCSECLEDVHEEATTCPHCGAVFDESKWSVSITSDGKFALVGIVGYVVLAGTVFGVNTAVIVAGVVWAMILLLMVVIG